MQMMLDLETLSLRPDAAVTAIGVAWFDDTRVIDTAGWYMRHFDWDGHIDPGTVRWWMEQSDAARGAVCTGKAIAKTSALDLRSAIEAAQPTAVWANDPSFDVVILKHWWERRITGLPFPISYKVERSCRTLFDMAKQYGIDYSSAWAGQTLHDPVSDAACQARAVIIVQNELRRRLGDNQLQVPAGGGSLPG